MIVKACILQLKLKDREKYVEDLRKFLQYIETDILVLPPFTGLLFSSGTEYIDFHRQLSKDRPFLMVPGSFVEGGYHKALILYRGDVIHSQCQTHLSAKDRKDGIERGSRLDVCSTPFGKIGILIGNDCFHPQTGRILGLQGADIVIGLYTAEGKYNRWLQISGIWQQVQQNQFFALESAANGCIKGRLYNGRSIVHNPIWEGSEGFLGEMDENKEGILQACLDFEKKRRIRLEYPLYRYLNVKLYKKEWGY